MTRHRASGDPDYRLHGLVLCAGASSRMGRPKGLLEADGVALLRLHVDAFAAAGLPVRVVLGPNVAAHLAVLPPGVGIVWNARWHRTEMRDSAAIGLAGLGDVLLTPVDVPPAAPETLAALIAAPGPAVPTFRGEDGHPVRLCPPHTGALRERLANARRVPVSDPEVLANLNRPDDWEAWLERRNARDAADSASRALRGE